MKLLPVIIFIVCSTASVVRAQSSEASIGFKGGLSVATQAEDFRENRYGFSGGIAGELQRPLAGHLSLGGQLEVLYTPRGAEVVVDGEQIGKVRAHYVDLTVSARPNADLGRLRAYLLLGAGLDVLVSASKDDAAGAGQDITSGLHRIDVALLGAVGVAVRLSEHGTGPLHLGTVFVEARHDIGLLDVDIMGGFKNRTSSVMLGLSFVVAGPAPAPAAATAAR